MPGSPWTASANNPQSPPRIQGICVQKDLEGHQTTNWRPKATSTSEGKSVGIDKRPAQRDPHPLHVHTSCSRNRRSVPSLSRYSSLRFAYFGPQPPLFLSSCGLPAANLLQTLRGLAIALVTGTRRVNGLATLPRTNTLPKSGFSRPVR
jgi:hypothetical protein